MDFVLFVLSVAFLIAGADIIIRGLANIAIKTDIPHYIIGAVFLTIGSTLPEIFVAVYSNIDNQTDILVSSIIGNYIFNITITFATILLIAKNIKIKNNLFRKDSIWIFTSLFILLLVSIDKIISFFDAIILIIIMILYITVLFESKKSVDIVKDIPIDNRNPLLSILIIIIGMILLSIGSIFIIESVVAIASYFNINSWIIGIIMVSFATSLPELIITILAIYKDKVDLAIANIIGSTIANSTIVIGFASLVKPIELNLSNHIFDIYAVFISMLFLILITVTNSYNRYMAIVLFIILALFIKNLFWI